MEETSEYIHSDTLFGAFCNAYRILYGKDHLEDLLEKFKKDTPFRISSAFPFVEDTYLFPLPKSTNLSIYSDDKKKFKKVQFVSQSLFEKILRGDEIGEILEDYSQLQDKKVLIERERDLDHIWRVKEVPRVTIDRKSNTSEIFHVSELAFSKGCGLFFLVEFNEDISTKFKAKFKAAINLLSQEGIGGERSCGKGLFEKPEFKDFKLRVPQPQSSNHLTLSLCYPSKEEVAGLKNGYYELIKRGGWIYSPDGKNKRKKGIRMIKEGSVYNGKITGSLKDVTPPGFNSHTVYRYGYSFNVPIAGVEERR